MQNNPNKKEEIIKRYKRIIHFENVKTYLKTIK